MCLVVRWVRSWVVKKAGQMVVLKDDNLVGMLVWLKEPKKGMTLAVNLVGEWGNLKDMRRGLWLADWLVDLMAAD